jgi:hypothetical protein
MSAYIVEPLHINALVSWACLQRAPHGYYYYWQQDAHGINTESATRIAAILHAENVRSVNTRYRESAPLDGFTFKSEAVFASRLSAVQVIKACQCLAYQSSEADQWKDSEAFAILRSIESAAVRCLPGYDEAEWSMPENTGRSL